MSTAPYASRTTTLRPPGEPAHPTAAIVAVFLGILVAILGFFSLLMWVDAHNARDDAQQGGDPGAERRLDARHGHVRDKRRRTAELRGRRTCERRRDRRSAQGLPRHAPGSAGRPGRRRAPRAQGRDRADRARHQVRRVGVGRRRTRPGDPRPPGPDGQDHAHELGRDPALGRLPRRARRAGQGVRRRDAGQVRQLHVPRERPGRLHVPLRHEAGAHAHRERHVRRDRRRASGGHAAEGRQELRARRERVVPRLRRPRRSRRSSTWTRRTRDSPTG